MVNFMCLDEIVINANFSDIGSVEVKLTTSTDILLQQQLEH